MTNINKITGELKVLFPESNAEQWDKVGLQYGTIRSRVEKVLVALDLTTEVLDKAIADQVDLIITHHPFIWEDTLELNIAKAPYKESIDERLKNTGIGLFSIHTNYDNSKKGTAYNIVKKLGYDNFYASKSSKYSYIFEANDTFENIEARLKQKLNLLTTVSKITDVEKVFTNVAILPGSGSIEDIISIKEKEDIDLFITSDFKWSDWLTTKELGVDVLELSHVVESAFVDDVAKIVNKQFKDVEVMKHDSKEIVKL